MEGLFIGYCFELIISIGIIKDLSLYQKLIIPTGPRIAAASTVACVGGGEGAIKRIAGIGLQLEIYDMKLLMLLKIWGVFQNFFIDLPFSQSMSPRSSKQFQALRDASRQKILDSSLELFGTKGYKSTTIADIVKKAGISKGLIYHYFDSKEDILKQLVDFFMEGGGAKVEELLKGSPKERLAAIVDWFFREMRENEHQWALFLNLTVQVHDFDFIHKLTTQKMNGYVMIFTELFQELGYENPTAEARILGALFDGIGMQYYVFNDKEYLEQMEQTLRDKYHLP